MKGLSARPNPDGRAQIDVVGSHERQPLVSLRQGLDVHSMPAKTLHEILGQRSGVRITGTDVDKYAFPAIRERTHQNNIFRVSPIRNH